MTRYVDSTEQLVTEIVVRDIRSSVAFYGRLGFELLRDGGDFVELTWEEHRLFLAELSAFRDVEHAVLAVSLHSCNVPTCDRRGLVRRLKRSPYRSGLPGFFLPCCC